MAAYDGLGTCELHDAIAAIRYVEEGHTGGKVVITV